MRFLAILLYLFPVPAFAHWGHLPELAGHSHWIGMAAAAAAAAAAAGDFVKILRIHLMMTKLMKKLKKNYRKHKLW